MAWLVAIAVPMGMGGADDVRSYPSAFSVWGVPESASGTIVLVLVPALVGLLVAAIVLALQPAEPIPSEPIPAEPIPAEPNLAEPIPPASGPLGSGAAAPDPAAPGSTATTPDGD